MKKSSYVFKKYSTSILIVVSACLLSNGVCASGYCQAQESLPDKLPQTPDQKAVDSVPQMNWVPIDCQAVITRRTKDLDPDYLLVADIDLPALESGKGYRLNIVLVNPFDSDVVFSSVGVSCGCIKFSGPEDRTIPAFGSARFVMELVVPNSIEDRRGRQQAKFVGVDAIDAVLLLNVEYDLSGGFGFRPNRMFVKVQKSEPIVAVIVPVTVVPPLKLNDLELQVSENLRDFSFGLIGDDTKAGSPYVKLELPAKHVPRHGILGELTLTRPGTEHRSMALVSIKHQEPIEIRPETVRLSRNAKSGEYEAIAILRVGSVSGDEPGADAANSTNTQNEGVDRETSTKHPVEVSLLVGGTPARLSVKQMGQSGVYRLTISHDGQFDADSSDTLSVRWKVVANGKELAIDSTALLPTR